ncbi:Sulfide:quinone oxidoreductase [Echinococcus granulosus]|uniref:Sulfide:quinone oxidoreductase n=1 Tax=Echinococcus granulosus TaxID=6210 RepID=W6U9K5_ECHGR|nr:Sulfide:quinone oxidoreductase [Echinococcus granulosus]EUB58058.1 Sulfide:quinone oxidoreductase [Echinococcus granulosus]
MSCLVVWTHFPATTKGISTGSRKITKGGEIFNLSTEELGEGRDYDFLHLTPPMTAPEVLNTATGLTSSEMNNFVNVDPQTLRHVKFNNIFSLGDCSSLPTSKTAAAISSESRVLCDNLTDVIRGGSGNVSKEVRRPIGFGCI